MAKKTLKIGKNLFIILTSLSVFFANSTAHANAFYIPQQNVTHLGTAYAGTAAWANDASVAYYNPAALTKISQEQIVVGGVIADSNTFLNVTNTTATNGAVATPSSGTTKPHATAVIPSLHYAYPINERLVFGVSSVSNFGSKNNFDSDSIARYVGTTSEMLTIDVTPSIGYKHNNFLSLGAGLDLFYAYAELSSAFGTGNVSGDGFSENQGNGRNVGVHAGILFEFNEHSRIGFNYRSRILTTLKGHVRTQTAAGAAITSQRLEAKIDYPEMVTLSGYHEFNDRFAVMADVQWFHWNRLKKVILAYEDGSSVILNYNYKNSYRYALGAAYQFNDKLQLKCGFSFDKTPIRVPWRTVAVLDEDQIALGIGAQYKLNKNLLLDFGYVHVFQDRASVSQSAGIAVNLAQTSQSLEGNSTAHLNAIGFQVTWNM